MKELTPFFRSPFLVGFDRLLEELTFFTNNSIAGGYPPYNVVRKTKNTINVEVALAGFNEDEIAVNYKNGYLYISGSKRQDQVEDQKNSPYYYKGISSRDFSLSLRINDSLEVKNATFVNGMLTVELVEDKELLYSYRVPVNGKLPKAIEAPKNEPLPDLEQYPEGLTYDPPRSKSSV